jgi:hypothetical protein
MLMQTLYQTVWTPPAQMRKHNGVLLHPDTFFFVSPPPEIGAVITASGAGITEELNRSSNTPILPTLLEFVLSIFSSWLAFLIALVYLFFFAVISLFAIWSGFLVWVVLNSFGAGSISSWLGGGLAAVLFARMYISMFRAPEAECSFVGELGIAHYWQTRKGIKGEVLRFSETTGLRKRITRIYRSGLYHKTSFEYSWNNHPFLSNQPTMRQRFSIGGAAPNILVNDDYRFAQAAERVWTAIRLQRAQAEFAQSGVARFSTAKGIRLDVGSGFLNVVFPNQQPKRIEAQELELTTGNGGLAIRRKADGKISRGFNPIAFVNVVVFRADEIDDLDVFLRLVNTIVLPKS